MLLRWKKINTYFELVINGCRQSSRTKLSIKFRAREQLWVSDAAQNPKRDNKN
jgi:hypothetical protein